MPKDWDNEPANVDSRCLDCAVLDWECKGADAERAVHWRLLMCKEYIRRAPIGRMYFSGQIGIRLMSLQANRGMR